MASDFDFQNQPITSDLQKRIAQVMEEERKQPKCWWYLSFAEDTGDPTTGKWLGGAVVFAPGYHHAVKQAWERGINPGGQCLGFKLKPKDIPSAEFHDRLLNEDDIKKMWPDAVRLADLPDDRLKKLKDTIATIEGEGAQ
jgi:hypothetical protein